MTKTQAQAELAAILNPINARSVTPSVGFGFGDFVEQIFLPFYKRKWKESTILTNVDRLDNHLTSEYRERTLGSFGREELQDFLDRKAAASLSYSTVAHLRWDLRQIFRMAVNEQFINRNPAELLFVPRAAKQPSRPVLTIEEVRRCLAVLEFRESLIFKLAVLVGMRPGEIFALKCGRLRELSAEIRERVYRGSLDSPKTSHSVRSAAVPSGLLDDIRSWTVSLPSCADEAWVFPSETLQTPVSKDNVWRRKIGPKLAQAGLGWVNFHVLRRTHATLMRELEVDPKVVSDQLGHSLDVNLNVYTQASLGRQKQAVDALETAVLVN